MSRVRRAIVSVSDKTAIEGFVRALHDLGVEVLSTGGTAARLREAGVPVIEVSAYTGFPEMLDGRVKTLHPKIHAGLLARRDDERHMEELRANGIEPIDMVVVNLYPFEKVVASPETRFHEAMENIDIGGPTLIRAAAKNFEYVAVVVDPSDYDSVRDELIRLGGELSYRTRVRLAWKVFNHTFHYDRAIAEYLSKTLEAAAE